MKKRISIAKALLIADIVFNLSLSVLVIALSINVKSIKREVVVKNETTESESAAEEVFEEEKEPNIRVNELWVVKDTGFEPVDKPLELEYQGFIYYLSELYDLDFYLVMAIIETESDYNKDLISETNDYGLMQINEKNHEWLSQELGITDFLDPYQNIKAGCYVFSKLVEQCNGNTTKALMSYNMGYSTANYLWDKGIYCSKYSDKVENKYLELKGEDE